MRVVLRRNHPVRDLRFVMRFFSHLTNGLVTDRTDKCQATIASAAGARPVAVACRGFPSRRHPLGFRLAVSLHGVGGSWRVLPSRAHAKVFRHQACAEMLDRFARGSESLSSPDIGHAGPSASVLRASAATKLLRCSFEMLDDPDRHHLVS